MLRDIPSEAAGPALLSIFFAIGLVVATRRRALPPDPARVFPAAVIAIFLQALHAAEEFATSFHHRLPRLLGVDDWSAAFFIGFNLAWIVLWALAAAAMRFGRAVLPATVLLWFLAIAAMANAIGHTLLSLATRSYFLGSATALPLGLAGLFLAARLVRPRLA